MATVEDLRAVALAMPDAVEVPHFGAPSFRVNGKIFAQEAVREPGFAILKLPTERLEVLCNIRPEAFTLGVWGRTRYGRLALSAVSKEDLAAYIEEAWRNTAPKRLAAGVASLSPRQ